MFLAYMRFSKIKEEFKEDYYNTMREDFIKIFNNKELYMDMMKNIEPKYKKMFELVLISDTSEEFLLSKEYCQMNNSLSWTITKPLRKINTLTRKAKNKL